MFAPDMALTELLALAAQGDRSALDRIFTILYPELRKIAHGRLNAERDAALLDTTTLVHEAFLRLVQAEKLDLNDRKHFFAYAARAMRNIIIDFARERIAQRRGGGAAPLPLNTELAEQIGAPDRDESLIQVNDALLALEAADPELARLVEMRYFAGYSEVEVAQIAGTSERTVRRQWEKARMFLLAALQK